MPVTVRIKGQIALVDGYKWFCADKEIEKSLTDTLDPDISPSVGDYDLYAAELAKKKLDAKIIDVVIFEDTEEVIY